MRPTPVIAVVQAAPEAASAGPMGLTTERGVRGLRSPSSPYFLATVDIAVSLGRGSAYRPKEERIPPTVL